LPPAIREPAEKREGMDNRFVMEISRACAASWHSLATTRHHQDADKVKSVGRQPHRSSVATYKTFVIGGLLGRVEF
jgi:hypothetical protein